MIYHDCVFVYLIDYCFPRILCCVLCVFECCLSAACLLVDIVVCLVLCVFYDLFVVFGSVCLFV